MAAVKDHLIRGLAGLGIAPYARVIDAFLLYLAELKKWNKAYNLTAITDDNEIVAKHFLDSLLYLKALPASTQSVCDIGSGAGFPGIPIALVRADLSVTLIEPSRKRCAFLRHIVKRLHVANLEVIESGAEVVGERRFDAVLTRATFSAAGLIKKTRHLLPRHGVFILSKGEKAKEELTQIPDGFQAETITVALPGTDIERKLIIVTPH